MAAAQYGHTETAEVLLREGADVNVQDKVRIATRLIDKLCQHNFENNRYSQEYENNAGIIGKAFCVIIT